ncbi:hypothetical protein NQ317_015295 [Molorchus minor]|uniref:Uncharacterized protein n=1 Tax=Molorchus minor TaxID=1323400 RepID=A0ABQ9ITL1_9CUCU|nr:hypothetical protein NQ317_015295 [Molorchus minor]
MFWARVYILTLTLIQKAQRVIEERRCPLEGCDSNGHLSGKFEKHFTLEACPIYHNTTAEKCRQGMEDRKKREESRKKALEYHKKIT